MAVADRATKLAGKFIVIDGPDGAGKSTHLKLLAEHLRGQGAAVREVRDPGGTVIGDKVRAILLDKAHDEMAVPCEVMLYMASRAQLVAQVIAQALKAGQCVLCDRYISSTVAYQGAGGADVEAILAAGQAAVGDVWPDLTVILDLPAEVGLGRIRARNGRGRDDFDRVESKKLEFHRKVRQRFLWQAKRWPEKFAVVDAAGEVEAVQQRLRQVIEGWPFKQT